MIKDFILEVLTEEQLDEKLIVYNQRKPYGQVVFLAGGAGSGKSSVLLIDACRQMNHPDAKAVVLTYSVAVKPVSNCAPHI